jgi:purine-binding chemotaxis protein CheW
VSNKSINLVTFLIDEQRCALHLSCVDRIAPMVEITSLPKAPAIVMGIINVQGQIIPVINIRRKFSYPKKQIQLSDILIIARTRKRKIALVADSVSGVMESAEEDFVTAENILPKLQYIKGVITINDGLVVIHDLDQFLSLEEETTMDSALKKYQK